MTQFQDAAPGVYMFFHYLFFSLVLAASPLASDAELVPNCPDSTWLMLCSKFHHLKVSLKSMVRLVYHNLAPVS